MSQQAFWLFLKMDKRNLFVQMALQCAPVLAGIKVSNLLIIEERYWKGLCFLLRNSGLCARKLYCCRDKITLLLYRREELEQWVKTLQVEALLKEIGYDSVELHRIFRKLEQRIGGHGNGEMPFPHELGLLLGYPAEDVRGFMGIGYKSVFTQAIGRFTRSRRKRLHCFQNTTERWIWPFLWRMKDRIF